MKKRTSSSVISSPVCCVPQIKAMTEDDMAYWWGLYIEKLTVLLAEADARPHGPAPHTARRIQALQREALFLHIR